MAITTRQQRQQYGRNVPDPQAAVTVTSIRSKLLGEIAHGMHRLVPLVGAATLFFQFNLLNAKAQTTKNPIGQISLEDPDYYLKVAACDLFAKVSTELMEWGDGKRETIYWDNKKQKLFESYFYSKPKALDAVKSPRYQPLVEELVDIWFGPSGAKKDQTYRSCVLAVRSVIEAGPQVSQTPKPQKKSLPVLAQSLDKADAHSQCLEARDYEGCIRAKTSPTTNNAQDECKANGQYCTVTTRGVDDFGLPKPMGWRYIKQDSGSSILYFRMPPIRIPHKGEDTRYIGFRQVLRFYKNPKAGTPGNLVGGGSAYTNCTGYGSSINCTTTGQSPNYIPGKAAEPGGVRSYNLVRVYDCKDDTHALYRDGKISQRWEKYSGNRGGIDFAHLSHELCRKGDIHIRENFDIYRLRM